MSRFSLLELMTSLAVASVLTAIALPMLYETQLRAMAVEPKVNVASIADLAWAYQTADDGTHVESGFEPRALAQLDATPTPWTYADAFQRIGWAPDGHVRCHYHFHAAQDGASGTPSMMADADCDLDRDKVRALRFEIRQSEGEDRTNVQTCTGGEGFRGSDCRPQDDCKCW